MKIIQFFNKIIKLTFLSFERLIWKTKTLFIIKLFEYLYEFYGSYNYITLYLMSLLLFNFFKSFLLFIEKLGKFFELYVN